MTDFSPELIADSVIALTSLIGLGLFARVLSIQQPRTEVTTRFLIAIQVVAALLAIRLLQWLTGSEWIGRLTYAVAGTVPLAVLLLTEALLRRHAPLALKIWTAGGALCLALVAILGRPEQSLFAIMSLAAFQVLAFVAMSVLVVTRDRQSLSVAENAAVDRLALSLVLIVPLALTDFRTSLFELPVRLSGIAILTLCWLGLTLRRSDAEQSDVVSATVIFTTGLAFASGCVMVLADLDLRTTVQVMAVVVSVVLLAQIYADARKIRREYKAGRVLDVLADAALTDHHSFLEALKTRALTSGAVVLDAEALRDFDGAFRDHVLRHGVISSGEVAKPLDPQLAEQLAWFFRKFEASHAILVSEAPFRIMVVNVPTIAQSQQLEQELRIAQRIAALLAARDAAKGKLGRGPA
jgi:hypothetical protein